MVAFPLLLGVFLIGTSAFVTSGPPPTVFDDSAERIAANANRTPAGTLADGVLIVHLVVGEGRWYPEAEDGPSLTVQAFGEVGKPLQIPGPLLRVVEGTTIHATITNTLAEGTLTIYGLHTRPGAARDTIQVAVGATREVRFEAGAPGTYFYWGTTTDRPIRDREDTDSQLSGGFIVDPAGTTTAVIAMPASEGSGLEDPEERVFVIGIWFQPADSTGPKPREEREVMVINGKSWPHTERLTFTVGDSVRWRWINASPAPHPMHLHGFYYRVDSRGSWAGDTIYQPDQQRLVATETMRPGGTMAVRWAPMQPGNWIFHCHFAFHVSHFLILPPDPAPGGAEAPVAQHAQIVAEPPVKEHRMAGLVMGMHVLPAPGAASKPRDARTPRKIRLLARSAPNRYGEAPGYGFVVHEGGPEPPPDSVPALSPTLVLRRGEPVRITVVNKLSQPTAVHWHGIELESFPDGVPNWSGTPGRIMPPIAPGDSFAAEFTPPRAGTFIYHSHSNELEQINSGLFGALIVAADDHPFDPATDVLIIAGGGGPEELHGTVNGFREPPPIDLEVGRTYRLRLININVDWRVMFTLVSDAGFEQWRAVAKDGADLPPSQIILGPAHLMMGPGETADFEFTPSRADELRLEVKTPVTGWHVPVIVRVRDRAGS